MLASHPFQELISPQAQEHVNWVRDFYRSRINLNLQNERRTFAPHLLVNLGRRGLLGLNIPEEYGGLPMAPLDRAFLIEKFCSVDTTIAGFFGVNCCLATIPLIEYASEELKQEFLPHLAAGQMLASCAITEEEAGSDFSQMKSTLTETADGNYRLSGKKIWIGNGAWCDVCWVLAKHINEAGEFCGMTACVVRAGMKGFALGREHMTHGLKGIVQSELIFNDVEVSSSDILGSPGAGFQVGHAAMQETRVMMGASGLGAMKRCFTMSYDYVKTREIKTGLLADNQETQFRLQTMNHQIKALESLVYGIAHLTQSSADIAIPEQALMIAKVSATEFLDDVIDKTTQMMGGRGYMLNHHLPYFSQDGRVTRIFEGPTETLLHRCGELAGLRKLPNFLKKITGDEWSSLNQDFVRLRETTLQYQDQWPSGEDRDKKDGYFCYFQGQVIYWIVLKALTIYRQKLIPFVSYEDTLHWLEQSQEDSLKKVHLDLEALIKQKQPPKIYLDELSLEVNQYDYLNDISLEDWGYDLLKKNVK